MIVGTTAKTIGTILDILRMRRERVHPKRRSRAYILSEYHPQNSVIKDATRPPGVDSMRVCLVLITTEWREGA